jgi:hypothetical protein
VTGPSRPSEAPSQPETRLLRDGCKYSARADGATGARVCSIDRMNPYSPPADLPPFPGAVMAAAAAPMPPGAVSEVAVDLLRQTRPWVMFLSVLSFIGCAFMLLAGLAMVGVGLMASGAEKGVQALIGAVYLPMAGLYVYPGIKMWTYGSAIGRLLSSRSTVDLEEALRQQKSFWKFGGIAAIVVIGLYIVVFLGALVVGVVASMGKV